MPIEERYKQCVNSIVSKYFDKQCPLNEFFRQAPESSLSLRNSYQNFPFRRSSTDQHALSFTGPTLWNKIPEETKRTTNLNIFKDNLKKYYLKETISQIFKKNYCY